MKPPLSPPGVRELMDRHASALPDILRLANDPLPGGKYRHWNRLRHLEPPAPLTTEQWWLGIKLARGNQYRKTPLRAMRGEPFVYALPDPVLARLHAIDHRSAGRADAPDGGVTPESRDRYILSSLIEEAINSSQLEGASTTRQVAAEMIRQGRAPRDKDERMILNNFQAMRAIRASRDRPLSIGMLLDLHRQLTEDTLDHPDAAGRFQTPDEERVVISGNTTGRVAHHPPPAERLPERMEALVRFANGADEDGSTFVNPLVRAIVLNFWLAHDHPFEDGNGRVARALFYWAMLRCDYWLFEFVSISHAIKEAPARYARAFLETETDGNDLTYFLIHQLEAIDQALRTLDGYLARKAEEVAEVERHLRRRGDLNYRQLALLSHAIRHPGHQYTIRSHQTSHGTAYATARSDLLNLAEAGFVDRIRKGKAWAFEAPRDLMQRMERAG